MSSYLLITNPFSSRALKERDISEIVSLFALGGASVDVVRTRGPGDALKSVSEIRRGYSAVVAAGGDGTINEIINGLDGHHVPVGIIPCGTANVLARELGIPHSFKKAVDVVLEGKELPLDVGLAGDRRFMLMASAGYDALVVADAHRKRGPRFGYASFIMPMLRTLWRAKFPEIKVTMDGKAFTCRHVVVANAPGYGGPFRPAPHAVYNDGLLDVVLYLRRGRYNMIRYGLRALCCSQFLKERDVLLMRGEKVRLSSSEDVPYQIDGDPAGKLPVTIKIRRDSATFIVP